MKTKKYIMAAIALFLSFTFVSCSNDPLASDDSTTDPIATDYSKAEHWLSLPASADKEVDVFYLYPTVWKKVDAAEPNVCAIDNPEMLTRSKFAFAGQATAFENVGNVYAPYYRQVESSNLRLSIEEQLKVLGGIPKSDILAAFDYYIKHFNNGRPFILAGHSQGSNLLLFILEEYMKQNPDVYNRMIAAYVIGYSITDQFLAKNPHLKFAEGSDDTGVIISYNTESPDVAPGSSPVVLPGALAINPITWTRDETLATADKNLGSIIQKSDGSIEGIPTPIMNLTDAKVDKTKGVVICSTVDVETWAPGIGSTKYARGVFHSFDYSFYYYNIRENATNRTKKFLGKQ
jgi:hypothetical protein